MIEGKIVKIGDLKKKALEFRKKSSNTTISIFQSYK